MLLSSASVLSLVGHHFSVFKTAPLSADRRFRSMFGTTMSVTATVYNLIKEHLPTGARPIHLLWALHFLKNYSTETVNSVLWKCDEKTYRKWSWVIIRKIAEIDVVRNLTILFILYTTFF